MTAHFWDKRGPKYDANVSNHDVAYDRKLAAAKALLSESDVVLDLGCASGEISLDVALHVQRIHGIDTSAGMIDLANQKAGARNIENARFDCMDVFDSRIEPSAYSAVIAFNVLHLVDDPAGVLARVSELMTMGGVLITKTPCLGEWNRLLQWGMSAVHKLGWVPAIHALTIPELESLVSTANFEIAESVLWDKSSSTQWITAQRP